MIRAMQDADWPSVKAIYEEGIATGHATFEKNAPSRELWDTSHLRDCRLVYEEAGQVLGFAALSPVSDRCVYGGVAEVMVYVAAAARGKGVGKALLAALAEASEAKGLWTLQAGIFPENKVSVALHEKCGYRIVGVREKLGQMDGVWRDVLLLERRSGKF
jgi:L-amino acid N-acyltransferase YncA